MPAPAVPRLSLPGAEADLAMGEGKGSSLYQYDFWRDPLAIPRKQVQKSRLLKGKSALSVEISLFKK